MVGAIHCVHVIGTKKSSSDIPFTSSLVAVVFTTPVVLRCTLYMGNVPRGLYMSIILPCSPREPIRMSPTQNCDISTRTRAVRWQTKQIVLVYFFQIIHDLKFMAFCFLDLICQTKNSELFLNCFGDLFHIFVVVLLVRKMAEKCLFTLTMFVYIDNENSSDKSSPTRSRASHVTVRPTCLPKLSYMS